MPFLKNFSYVAKCNRVYVVTLQLVQTDGFIKKAVLRIKADNARSAGKKGEKIIREKWEKVRSVKYLFCEDTADWTISY